MVNDGEYMLIVGACWCLIDKPFVNPYKDNSNLVTCSRIEHVKRCQEIIEDGGCYKKQQYKVGTVHVLTMCFWMLSQKPKRIISCKGLLLYITVINWIWGYPIFGQSHIDALTALTTITVLAQNSSQRRLSI